MSTITDHGERLARLEGAYDHLATKADIARLEGKLNVVIMVMLGGFGVLIPLILIR